MRAIIFLCIALIRPAVTFRLVHRDFRWCRIIRNEPTRLFISSGLTFEDGRQVLVSVQKPLGLILEQDSAEEGSLIRIVDMDPSGSAAAAGLRIGDVLVAVQNADMVDRDLEYALKFIAQAPKVLNLRFVRMPNDPVDADDAETKK